MAQVVQMLHMYVPSPFAGRPVSNGFIYIGVVDQNPVTNPIQVRVQQENGTEVPIAQPIRTNAGGIPVDVSGNVAILIVDSDYSMRIDNSLGAQQYYVADSSKLSSDSTDISYRGTNVQTAIDKTTADFETVEDAKVDAEGRGVLGTLIRTRKYHAASSEGSGWGTYAVVTPAEFTAATGIVTPDGIGDHVKSDSNVLMLLKAGSNTILTYGALHNTEITTQVTSALAREDLVTILDGTFTCDTVSTSRTVDLTIEGSATLRSLNSLSTVGAVFTFTGNNCTIRSYGEWSGSNLNRSILDVQGNFCEIIVRKFVNVNSLAVPPGNTISGLVLSGNNCTFDVYAEEFENQGNPNDSVPRIVSCNQALDFVGKIKGKNVNCGIINSTSKGHLDSIILENANDNGIYHLADSYMSVDTFVYDGSEEALVNGASTVEISQMIVRKGITPVAVQNAIRTTIDSLIFEKDASRGYVGPTGIIRARTGNTHSGPLHINSMTGRIRPTTFGDLSTNGTIEHVSIRNVDLVYEYDNTIHGSLSSFFTMSGVQSYSLIDWDLKFVDVNNVLIFSDRPTITLPTAPVSDSFVSGFRFNTLRADETTDSAAEFRMANAAVQKAVVTGQQWQVNVGPYVRECTYLGGIADAASANPNTAGGYYKAGIKRYKTDSIAVGSPVGIGWIKSTSSTTADWLSMQLDLV